MPMFVLGLSALYIWPGHVARHPGSPVGAAGAGEARAGGAKCKRSATLDIFSIRSE